MARHSIQSGLVVCYEADAIDPANNAYVRELASTRPWITSLAFLDPQTPPAMRRVEDLLPAGHAGIAVYLPDAAAAKALLSWPQEIWDRLGRSRAIVSFNARPEATAELQALIERAEHCAFLFSHLGLPGRHDSVPTAAGAAARLAPLLRLARLTNVGVKISGLYAVDPIPPHPAAWPFIELLLENFDPSNLHWGSDFSPVLEFTSFEDTLAIPALDALAGAVRDLIMGDALAAKLDRVTR